MNSVQLNRRLKTANKWANFDSHLVHTWSTPAYGNVYHQVGSSSVDTDIGADLVKHYLVLEIASMDKDTLKQVTCN